MNEQLYTKEQAADTIISTSVAGYGFEVSTDNGQRIDLRGVDGNVYITEQDRAVEQTVMTDLPSAAEPLTGFGEKLAETMSKMHLAVTKETIGGEENVVSLTVDEMVQQGANEACGDVVGEEDFIVEDPVLDNLSPNAHENSRSVDLTPLLNFNENRGSNKSSSKKKKKPKINQQPQVEKPAQRSVLLQSEKSKSYVREAMQQSQPAYKDGVHHINTSTSATTQLGRALEINSWMKFNHPDLGPFNSVGGLWFYIGGETQDEAFRELHGNNCRSRGAGMTMRKVKGFRTIIAEATWIKIRTYEKLVKEIVDNELPFRCYYTVGELAIPKETAIAEWYMPVLEEIARTLKEIYLDGKEDAFPNFDFLEFKKTYDNRPQHKRY